MIPYPFGRGIYVIGKPIVVPAETDDDGLERKRLELEAVLCRLTAEANALAASRSGHHRTGDRLA